MAKSNKPMSALATIEECTSAKMIPLKCIAESKANPRKTFAGMDELVASVKEKGFLQPILVRPIAEGKFEIICGARRFRAAKQIGYESMGCIVRDISESEAMQLRIIENSQRADVHPMEEAEGYQALMREHKLSVDEIAAHTGKSKSTIYQRLSLLMLVPEARKLFYDGALSATIALMVARIPDTEDQKRAVKRICDKHNPMSARHAADWIMREFMLNLKDAPWDKDDAALCPDAGSCKLCPKRTGANPNLFSDVGDKDLCTDPTCFAQKMAAHDANRLADAASKGFEVISPEDAAKLFQYRQLKHNAPFVDINEKCWDDHPKYRTFRAIIGKTPVPRYVAIEPEQGKRYELVLRTDLQDVLTMAGIKKRHAADGGSSDEGRARNRAAAKRQKIAARARRLVMGAIVDAVEKKAPTMALWRVMAEAITKGQWSDTCRDIVARRALPLPEKKKNEYISREKPLLIAIEKMNEAQLRGLVVESLASRHQLHSESLSVVVSQFCKVLGVNGAKCYSQARAELTPKKGKKTKSKKASTP